MAKEAVDFTKVNTKKYRLWRILHSDPTWATIYRHRNTTLSGFKSALIFPEQLLGLNQSRIWWVTSHCKTDEVSITIKAIRDFSLVIDRKEVQNVEQIFEFERESTTTSDRRLLCVGQRSDHHFILMSLFSSLGDATKFAEKEQRKHLSKYC